MSLYSDFYPQDGTDLIPGVVQNISDSAVMDGINYLDITDGVIVDKTLYPHLDANLFIPDWEQTVLEQEINNPVPASNDNFGTSIELYDNTLVIGAWADADGPNGSGSVYVYARSGTTWTLQQTINNPSIAGSFGWSVSLYKDTLVGGGYQMPDVLVYTRSGTTWTLEQTITLPGGAGLGSKGSSLYENTLVAGADNFSTYTGKAYIYTRSGTTWTLEQTIENPTATTNSYFGAATSIFEDKCAIGSYGDNTVPVGAGSVYIYTRTGTTWTLEQKLAPPTANQTYFGGSVKMLGNLLIVGAYGGFGSVCVYRFNGVEWELLQIIENPEPVSGDDFGKSVSTNGNDIIIGAHDQEGTGTTRIYTRTNDNQWVHSKKLVETDPVDFYGWTSSMYNDTIAVGAMYDDIGAATGAGSVFVYTAQDANTFSIQGQDQALKVTK